MTLHDAIRGWRYHRAEVLTELKLDAALSAEVKAEKDRLEAPAGLRGHLLEIDPVSRVHHRVLGEMLAALKETP